jgi:tetratricopeptide (TPR) repeat protein
VWDDVSKKFPDSKYVAERHAMVFVAPGDFDVALAYINKAIALNKGFDPWYHKQKSQIYLKKGDFQLASNEVDTILSRTSREDTCEAAQAIYQKGRIYAKRGWRAHALWYFDQSAMLLVNQSSGCPKVDRDSLLFYKNLAGNLTGVDSLP